MQTNTQSPTPEEKFVSAIGYLSILCIVPLVFYKRSPFAQHHGKQGLTLLLAWLTLWLANLLPILGAIIWVTGSLVLFILIILGIINAFHGKLWEMPVLGKYAKTMRF